MFFVKLVFKAFGAESTIMSAPRVSSSNERVIVKLGYPCSIDADDKFPEKMGTFSSTVLGCP
jgi:hypothetical protein